MVYLKIPIGNKAHEKLDVHTQTTAVPTSRAIYKMKVHVLHCVDGVQVTETIKTNVL